jgi:glutamine synthetase
MLKQPVGAVAQHEFGMKYDTLIAMADQMHIYEHLIHARSGGRLPAKLKGRK